MIFITKTSMYFYVTSKVGLDTVSRLVNASSWSNCLSYMEGTGENLQSIGEVSPNITVVVNDPTSTSCYNVTLKDQTTEATSTFILVDNSYSSVQNWISQQTNKFPKMLQQQEKSYVTV
jgi:hypothetical protein